MKNLITLFILLILLSAVIFATGFHVYENDPVYDFLERLDSRNILIDFLDNERPLTRDYIADQLRKIDERRSQLSPRETSLLDHYLILFEHELTAKRHPSLPDDGNTFFALSSFQNFRNGLAQMFTYRPDIADYHLIIYQHEDDLLWFDLDEMIRFERKNGINRWITRNSFRVSLQLGEKFTLYGDTEIYDQQVKDGFEDPAREYKGGQYEVKERGLGYSSAAFEYSSAYIQYSSSFGDLILGVEPLIWGTGSTSLILSDNVDPFAFLAWKKIIGKSRISYFHGFINPPEEGIESTTTGEKSFTKKYIVGHRWDIRLTDKLDLGVSEMLSDG